MAALAFVVFFLLAGTAQSVFSDLHPNIEDYPSVVQIEFQGVFSGIWGHSCAGHILNHNHILSAAQCFHGLNYEPRFRRIRAGTSFRESGGTIIYVDVQFNHPSYGLQGYDGDISVVKLKNRLMYGPLIAPGAIVSAGHDHPDSMPVVHIGWGPSLGSGPPSEQLLKTTASTENNEECRKLYSQISIPEIVTENMICSRRHNNIANVCQGDTGGPLYHENDDNTTILLGVISWDHGCSGAEYPGVSTRVASYTTWIVETVV